MVGSSSTPEGSWGGDRAERVGRVTVDLGERAKTYMSAFRTAVWGLVAGVVGLGAASTAVATAEPSAEDAYRYVSFKTTKGEIILELNKAKAPVSVENFLKYVEDGFYDGTVFHRVVDGSIGVIQGGGFGADLVQKPTGDPIINEWTNGLKNDRGTISMARTNAPNSATTQFFINTRNNPPLSQAHPQGGSAGYAVFGSVIGGMDVVDQIGKMQTTTKELTTATGAKFPSNDVPSELVVIEKAEVVKAEQVSEQIALARAAQKEADRARATAAAEEASKQRVVGEAAFKEAESFLKQREYDLSKGVMTDSGLWYLDLEQGSGKAATATSTVRAHYTGWLADGKKFDSSVDRGEPATFPLTGVVKGWTEGVGTMKEGGKRLLVIPYPLGYGMGGRPPTIPQKATLVFEVELLNVLN